MKMVVIQMQVLEKITDLLEKQGQPFDYILSTGEKVVVVRAFSSYNQFLFEAEDLFELLSILEKESDKVGCIWCRNN